MLVLLVVLQVRDHRNALLHVIAMLYHAMPCHAMQCYAAANKYFTSNNMLAHVHVEGSAISTSSRAVIPDRTNDELHIHGQDDLTTSTIELTERHGPSGFDVVGRRHSECLVNSRGLHRRL